MSTTSFTTRAAATTVGDAIREGHAGRRVLIMAGATRDWFLHADTAVKLPEYLAYLGLELGLATVLYRRGCRAEELPVPGAILRGVPLPRATDPSEVLPDLLSLAEDGAHSLLIVIDGVENLLPDAESPVSSAQDLDLLDHLQRVAVSPDYSFSRSLIVLVEHTAPVHHRLRTSPAMQLCVVPPPNQDERCDFIRLAELTANGQVDACASVSAGLTLDEIHFLAKSAQSAGGSLEPARLTSRKGDMLRAACPNLELLSTPYGLDHVAGMHPLKRWLRQCIAIDRVPKMVLLTGPAGTGKSYVARAMAAELGVPAAKVNLMNSPYVGENERALRATQQRIESMGDVLVFIDEMDSRIGARQGGPQGDSGTSNRLVSELLEWTGDVASRRGVTIVGAANRADRIDRALISRMTWVLPFLHPTPRDLVEMIPVMATEIGLELEPDLPLAQLVRSKTLESASGRELHAMLERAALLAGEHGRRRIDAASMRQAIEAVPNRDRDEDRFWTFLALDYTTDSQLLPWFGPSGFDPAAVPALAADLVDDTGTIDQDRLSDELVRYRQRYGA
jgi:hypothetical protein